MTDTRITSGNGQRVVFRGVMILSLIGTVASGIWWAAAFTQEVRTMQESIEHNTEYSVDMGKQVFSLRERAAADGATNRATQRRLKAIDDTLRRIEGKIDQATRRGRVQ